MYRATREFIKARELHTNGNMVRKIENVKQVGGGVANQCYSNAHNAKDEAAKNGERVFIISGWLVQPFDKKTNSVSIIAHWWNADSNGLMFDTSPLVSKEDEYVQDSAIFKFCVENDAQLKTHMHNSLLYQNENFEVLIDAETMAFRAITELKTEYFYDLA
jgi:hypothetical protein